MHHQASQCTDESWRISLSAMSPPGKPISGFRSTLPQGPSMLGAITASTSRLSRGVHAQLQSTVPPLADLQRNQVSIGFDIQEVLHSGGLIACGQSLRQRSIHVRKPVSGQPLLSKCCHDCSIASSPAIRAVGLTSAAVQRPSPFTKWLKLALIRLSTSCMSRTGVRQWLHTFRTAIWVAFIFLPRSSPTAGMEKVNVMFSLRSSTQPSQTLSSAMKAFIAGAWHRSKQVHTIGALPSLSLMEARLSQELWACAACKQNRTASKEG